MNQYQTQESDMQVKNCTKDFPIPNIPLQMTDTWVSNTLHSSFFYILLLLHNSNEKICIHA